MWAIRAVLLLLLYVGLAWLGMWLAARPPSSLTVIWFPAGVGLVATLVLGQRGLIVVFLASAIANGGFSLYNGFDYSLAAFTGSHLLLAVLDTTQTWLASRGLAPQTQPLQDRSTLNHFFWHRCFIPPLLTVWALILVNQSLRGALLADGIADYLSVTAQVTVADILGLFIVAPLYLALRNRPWQKILTLTGQVLGLLAIPIVLAWFIYPPLISFAAIITIYIAVRFRLAGSTLALALIAAVSVAVIATGQGLYASDQFNISYVNLSIILLCCGLAPHYIALALEELNNANASLEDRVEERTRALEEANLRLEVLAFTDSLTGLYNRRAFVKRLESEVERSKRTGNPFALAMLDLDYFKKINDTYGHQTGDLVLRTFARIISKNLRNVDTAGRWGGEEFIILCPESHLDEMRVPLERIRNELKNTPVMSASGSVIATVSIGMTCLQSREDSIESLCARADEALYAAKKGGRDLVLSSRDIHPSTDADHPALGTHTTSV